MSESPRVIGFEVGVGEFRISTGDVIYEIRVIPELVRANTAMGVLSPVSSQLPQARQVPAAPQALPAAPDPLPAALPKGADAGGFFQEISQELFGRIGQLARQLSISVTELPVEDSGLSRTGADLENAKGQLEEVVEITEKASLQIMDIADLIQADMESLNGELRAMSSLAFLIPSADVSSGPGAADASPGPAGADSGEFMRKFSRLRELARTLAVEAQGSPSAAPDAAGPEAPPHPEPQAPPLAEPKFRVSFQLDVVFQTLYEFCTNETVKDHIKKMRQDASEGGFDAEGAAEGLSAMALKAGEDDGYYNLPIPDLLKLLYTHTANEENRTTLKKMNQTAGTIFLDQVLPLEGVKEELPAEALDPAPGPEAAPEPEAAPAPSPDAGSGGALQAGLAEIGELVGELDGLIVAGAVPGGGGGNGTGGGGAYTSILTKDRDAVATAVASSENLIQNTTKHLTNIMEALSFQDLSGQRIKKIVGMISDIQVQLLSMLVAVDTKIKAHHEDAESNRPKEETEKFAQEEVDKMLEKLSGEPSELMGPGAENRLDQGAVNDLLSQLGF
ncbi:MAG: protein phosphatase CheZ [Deltaproteobacteria bacterium]|jgi:chemotaxis regulatin CheY-phosphate phosphatase CheZ|nr:protein phosphatase CheZ [Deltaproteobacteria bacterium]